MSNIIYETPHMVVSGHLERGCHLRNQYDVRTLPDNSYWIVRLLITLQINWKLSYLEFSGDFHKWIATEETYEEWEGMYYILDQLWYKFEWSDLWPLIGREILDKLYEVIEYYSKPA